MTDHNNTTTGGPEQTAGDPYRAETGEFGVDEYAMLLIQLCFARVGVAYPAPTRAHAIVAIQRIRSRTGDPPLDPDQVARLSRADADALRDVSAWLRYALDTVDARTLTVPRVSTDDLVRRVMHEALRAGSVDGDGLTADTDIDVVSRRNAAILARIVDALLRPRSATADNATAAAVPAEHGRPGPDDDLVLDVLAEYSLRLLFRDLGLPYPPRMRADVVEMLQRQQQQGGTPPLDPDTVIMLGDSRTPLQEPPLAWFTDAELAARLPRLIAVATVTGRPVGGRRAAEVARNAVAPCGRSESPARPGTNALNHVRARTDPGHVPPQP